MGWRGLLHIFFRSVGWWILSKAFVKSIATAAVRKGGLGWLKPCATAVVSGRRADVVECMGLNPCWFVLFGSGASSGSMSFSSTLLAGHSREMGL